MCCSTEKVGKTSIIEVLITEKFQPNVQPVLPVVVVPKNVTPERVNVAIVDTPGDPNQVEVVDEQLKAADVIVLVYDVNNDLSSKRVSSHWLPKFRAAQLNVPVILVGNKIDVRGGIADPSAAAKMEEFIKPIMDDFREVDVCIECSAKTVSNISEVFYFAQKAVLYPTGQVYDVDTHCLKPDASTALRRIFKLCDKDGDGGLNDKELNDFQYHCFSVYLKEEELEGVKKVVSESCPQNGINADGSLSEEGFIFLHTLFVQKGRLETTWIVLRKFGYDDDMRLQLDESEIPACNDDQTIELSAEGKNFLGNLFAAADSDADGMLSPNELRKLFAACPDGPFAVKKKVLGDRLTNQCDEDGKEGYMTLEAFMARWTMYLMDSVKDCLLSFRYLGYNDEKSALKVTKGKRRDRYNRAVSKDVVRVAVLGSDSSLKAGIVRGLVGMSGSGTGDENIMSGADVTYVERDENDLRSDKSKTVVLRQVAEEGMSSFFASRSELESTDVMCIVFDAGNAVRAGGVLDVGDDGQWKERAGAGGSVVRGTGPADGDARVSGGRGVWVAVRGPAGRGAAPGGDLPRLLRGDVGARIVAGDGGEVDGAGGGGGSCNICGETGV
ncbi:Small GTPase [Gracilaria domingensis]|nr:Small GTPase [Gracilaria domingensis]